jgi:hypothetical protein
MLQPFTISEIMAYFNIPFLLHCPAGHSFARQIELSIAVSCTKIQSDKVHFQTVVVLNLYYGWF